jgi:GNAT superfamily N-acetyltransferase
MRSRADRSIAFPLPPTETIPTNAFADLGDPDTTFTAAGGELIVAELDGHIAAMGGFRPVIEVPDRVEILRVRVHPARRRLGLGTAVMDALETTAAARGYRQAWLDTASNQPEAMAFSAASATRRADVKHAQSGTGPWSSISRISGSEDRRARLG